MSERLEKIKKQISRMPQSPGVYIMRDRFGKVIYVGKAKDLKKRVSSYFQPSKKAIFIETQPKIAALISLAHDLEVIIVKNEAEALVLESKLIKQWKPRYNTFAKDDKHFYLVRVDIQSPIPQFRLTRNRTDSASLYFGPFTNSVSLKKTLHELRSRYGIILGDTVPSKIKEDTYRLYNDARAEIYGQPNEFTVAEYREHVLKACAVLEGKAFEWCHEVEQKMLEASKKQDFETAAKYRDLLQALKDTQTPRRQFKQYLEPVLQVNIDASEQLRKFLNLEQKIETMECFDISHVSGEFVVASMVCFKNGKPDKKNYRKFKIRSFTGNDDYRAMEEVVGRRYKRLHIEGKSFPDLIIIDGGLGQVHAALKAFLLLNLKPPQIIGLAKKQETIVFPDERKSLNLPHNTPALRLLQRIRDEAHRFANAFNAELRSKKIKESILDDFPGIGPARKEIILNYFKSLANLKKASAEDIKKIPGIGIKMANDLYEFLKNH